ncbi:MAG: ArnT family glycosyltransferase [Candidatus Methylomirabilis sp.]
MSNWARVYDKALPDSLVSVRAAQLIGLGLVGFLAFFYNLNHSFLEGSEGLYADITREMVRSHQFLQLRYQGEFYFNKPPLFFWLLALSTSLFGENEVAFRLPGAMFSLGTMALTYALGLILFSRTAAFWAALVVATSHVFLWYGPRVLFDSALTFFITLALLGWVQASLRRASPWWYLLSFLAMALGAMMKELHGFALPALLILAYAAIQRDVRMIRQPFFWIGLLTSLALVTAYAWMLASGFQGHFQIGAGLQSMFGLSNLKAYIGDRPIYWYLSIMWFDFFPWCALIPSSLVLLFARRPLRNHPAELFVVLWVLGFFLVFSLAQAKREPYLMPIVPGLGLMIGYFFERVFTSAEERAWATPLFKLTLGSLAVAYILAMLVGPSLLQRKWHIPATVFPVEFVAVVLSICAMLLYALARSRARTALVTLGVLAITLVVGVVHFVVPAIDQAASPRQMVAEVTAWKTRAPGPILLYAPGWPRNEDAVYYLKQEPAVQGVHTEEALVDMVTENGTVMVVTEEQHLRRLKQRTDLSIDLLREFQQPKRKNFLLLSIRRQ